MTGFGSAGNGLTVWCGTEQTPLSSQLADLAGLTFVFIMSKTDEREEGDRQTDRQRQTDRDRGREGRSEGEGGRQRTDLRLLCTETFFSVSLLFSSCLSAGCVAFTDVFFRERIGSMTGFLKCLMWTDSVTWYGTKPY